MASAKCLPLIVDDDDDLREAMRDAIAADGYDCHEARDGQEALRFLRSNEPPPVILLDWNMPTMNGQEFMSEVALDADLSKIPVILLSADVRVAAQSAQYGFAGYLTKPFDVEALLDLLRRYCDQLHEP